ncbi:MAG: hypothetical protein WBN80_09185 [Prochlorococcaceae cyanobacterium]
MIAWLGQAPDRTCGQMAESFLTAAIPGGALYFLAIPERVIFLHGIRPNQVHHHDLGDRLDPLR